MVDLTVDSVLYLATSNGRLMGKMACVGHSFKFIG